MRPAHKKPAKRSIGLIVVAIILILSVGLLTMIFTRNLPQGHSARTNVLKRLVKPPQNLDQLLSLKADDLSEADIARMNLLCADGLPGAENLNVEENLATLDQWAQHIKAETDRNYHRFRDDPGYFSNSEAFYKMLMMAVVLYEDYGVRYNPKLITSPDAAVADDSFFSDSRDILLHGLTGPQHLGTCSSMPVLYIALGRRLNYPLKLVKAKGHLFLRWDSLVEKFDMDATGKGLDKYEDTFYKQWPFPLSEGDIQEEDYLKSLSAKEELSVFLSLRGACQTDNGLLGDALASFSLACKLVPTWKGNQVMLAQARHRLDRPVVIVQQQQPLNPNIPADPTPMRQNQPRNSFKTPGKTQINYCCFSCLVNFTYGPKTGRWLGQVTNGD
jgi:hypothetical protein